MTRRPTTSPRRNGNENGDAGLEPIVARLGERESLLRSLLLDARDELVRARLGTRAAAGRELPPASATAPAEPADRGPVGYPELRERLLATVRSILPSGSRALFVSRGDPVLVEPGAGLQADHFPGSPEGRYAGHHPADSGAAVAELESRRAAGADFLVFPATSLWWLDHYSGLATHLARSYRRVLDAPDTGIVYDLRRAAPELAPPAAAERPLPLAAGSSAIAATPGRRRFAATTIISRNYLAQARVLAKSFLEHEPDGRFYLLVVDGLPEGVEPGVEVTLVDPRELAIASFYEMCFKYGVVELSTAVKPYLLSLLMAKHEEENVVYLDPDILITRPMDALREALDEHEAVLTPHIMSPLPDDGKHPNEQDIMISGAYNLGFIALRRSDEARRLLAWWEERLADGCRIDVPNGLFTDQKWIDLVPSLFPFATILRDPSYNVAFWNLHERTVSRDGDLFLVNGEPGTFFHVSGFDPRKPLDLSKHQSRIEVEPGSGLAELLAHYAARLLDEGYEVSSRWEYGYDRFASGVRVHPLLRQLFLKLSPDERARFGDPFAVGPGSFLDWATGPGEKPDSLSRFLEAIYQIRYDLPLAFPDARGRDRARFLEWAERWGSEEMGFERELVRDVGRAGESSFREPDPARSAARRGEAREEVARPATADPAYLPLPGDDYRALLDRIHDVGRAALPVGARVLVVNKGDYRMLDLGGAEGWHFPQTPGGVYGGFYPADSAIAIAHLEALRAKGADHLLVPRIADWWFDHYADFARHLARHYRLVVDDPESCRIYDLGRDLAPVAEVEAPAEAPPDEASDEATDRRAACRRPASEERPVVIYGAARSGTTYLVKILNRHPKIYISDESRIFLWAHEMSERLRWYERAAGSDLDEPGGRRIGDRRRLGDFLTRSLATLTRDFYRELEPRAEIWGDKNPHYADPRDVGCLETIVELFPKARFLHIVRDGRDVVTSGMRGVWTDFESVHSMWTSHLDLGRSFGRSLAPGQYLEFHYEELVADDVGMAARILDFLGVENDPAVERFCRAQQRKRTPFCNPTREMEADPLRSDWSTFFTPAEKLRSLDLLGPNLVRFGYESEGSLARARGELVPLAAGEEPPI